MYLPNNIYSK